MAFNKAQTEEDLDIVCSKDKRVIFDATSHTYLYEGQSLISVTTFIKTFTEPFNSLFPSINKTKSNKTNKTGITDPHLLRKYWKLGAERATNLGTATHAFAEMYILDRNTPIKTGYDRSVVNAITWLEQEWEIMIQEEIVYNILYGIAGSIDLKLRHKKTKRYGLGDWKVTEDMTKSYNKLKEPFNNLKDSALNKYSIQLDSYSILSNELIDEKDRFIIQLRNNGEFNVYHPTHEKKEFQLPFTLDKTKEAMVHYSKYYNKINK